MTKVWNALAEEVTMKDLGEVSMALRTNIEVDRKVGIIKIHNQPYIEEVLDRFGYTDCNPANTPADPNPNNALSKDDWDKEPDKCADLPFRPLLGCLWWVCVMQSCHEMTSWWPSTNAANI